MLQDEVTLPSTGTYTVDINVNQIEQGNVTVQLGSS